MALKPLIHYQTQSDEPIRCYGNLYRIRDFIGPLHWFLVATDRIVGMSLLQDRGFTVARSLLELVSRATRAWTSYARRQRGGACDIRAETLDVVFVQ